MAEASSSHLIVDNAGAVAAAAEAAADFAWVPFAVALVLIWRAKR